MFDVEPVDKIRTVIATIKAEFPRISTTVSAKPHRNGCVYSSIKDRSFRQEISLL